MSLSVLRKPRSNRVFIDTSVLLSILDVNSENEERKQTAECYRKVLADLLPTWKVLGIINPLVLLEMIEVLQRNCLRNRGIPLGRIQEIKKEMARHPR